MNIKIMYILHQELSCFYAYIILDILFCSIFSSLIHDSALFFRLSNLIAHMGYEADGKLVPIWDIRGSYGPYVTPNANPNDIIDEIISNPNPQPQRVSPDHTLIIGNPNPQSQRVSPNSTLWVKISKNSAISGAARCWLKKLKSTYFRGPIC